RHDGRLPLGCRSRVDRELRLGMDHPADAEDAQGILGFHDDGAKAVPAPAIHPDAAAVDEGGQRAQPQVGDPLARGRAVARSDSFAVLRPRRPVGPPDPADRYQGPVPQFSTVALQSTFRLAWYAHRPDSTRAPARQ